MSEVGKEAQISSFGQLRGKAKELSDDPDTFAIGVVEKMFVTVRAYSPFNINPGADIPAVNVDPRIQTIREAIDGKDYATAIDQAQLCYQKYYLPNHPDAPPRLDDFVLNVAKRETSEQAT